MLNKLLSTVAVLAVISAPAFAQQAPQADSYLAAAEDQILTSSVLGKTVFTTADEKAEAIGDVNDVVIGPQNGVAALVVGVGGFLGIGEKDVAVRFDRVSWAKKNGERVIVVAVTKAELETAPEFDRAALMEGVAATLPEDAPSQPVAGGGSPASVEEARKAPMGTTPSMTDPNVELPAVDTATTGSTAGKLQPVDVALLTADKLVGTEVRMLDGTRLGTISEALADRNGTLDAYVVDVGGFLGKGEKPVALSTRSVKVMADLNGAMIAFSPFSRDDLQGQAPYSGEAYKADRGKLVLSEPLK